jgi:predicted RNA-binding Zn ribbon-like protein
VPRCAAVKADNSQCERIVGDRSQYCYSHDPTRKEQRRAAASKAGKVKAALSTPAELREVKARLKELADEVLSGKAARADASVAAQVLGVYLKAVSVELKAREQAELVERLEELEDVLNRKDASGWR